MRAWHLGVLLAVLCALCVAKRGPVIGNRQVIAFQVSKDNWRSYDWSALTTVVLYGGLDPAMVPVAEANGVALVWPAVPSLELLVANETTQDAWIDTQVRNVVATNASGINVDFESPIPQGSSNASALTRLLLRLGSKLRPAVIANGRTPHYSIDVAWRAGGIDGRFYEYAALGQIFDFTVIMDYDTRSQVFGSGPCLAGANAPRETVMSGVESYLALGIPRARLVLGTPWYGYDYPCVGGDVPADPTNGTVCEIKRVEFRGCSCSDAAGTQHGVNQLAQWALGLDSTVRRVTPVHVNATALATWWNYVAADGMPHQVWSDDAATLGAKWGIAAEQGLGGVSMWNVDYLVASHPAVVAEMNRVWEQLRLYLRGY